jgi:hypothetical protein
MTHKGFGRMSDQVIANRHESYRLRGYVNASMSLARKRYQPANAIVDIIYDAPRSFNIIRGNVFSKLIDISVRRRVKSIGAHAEPWRAFSFSRSRAKASSPSIDCTVPDAISS